MQVDPATRHAIETLVIEHAWLIDHGQADRVVDLYTDEAELLGIGPDKAGRVAIAAWAAERAAMTTRCSRHLHSNLRLLAIDADRVEGTVALMLYRHDGPGSGPPKPLLIADYDDVFQRGTDSVWRFARRRLSVVFSG